jgi:hypothetical protein
MVDQSIISLVAYEQNTSVSLKNELSGEWSEVMKDQIRGYIAEQQIQQGNQIAGSPGTHRLTQQTVAKLGRKFQADYIVRGRILEFKTRQEHTWAPWKRGILPFIFGTNDQLALGFARTDQYDFWNDMRADGFLGFLDPGKGEQEYSSGQVDQAVIQIRIWIQEAATGNVVWTNRIDVKTSPKSMWADKQHDALFDQAIETGVTTLVDNFIATGL